MKNKKKEPKKLMSFRMFNDDIEKLKKLSRMRSKPRIKLLEESLSDYFKKMTPEERAEIIK